MQLKKLQLLGFKTFADKTEIEIGSGLTAIVGPNGSGKSNIVDALLWVLGEQNPRLLRGASAQDVIFAGTDRRKPMGMAEVKLTIDNADGALPIKFTEVTVTRRIYRSGDSQYLLNGSNCRLKDIIELFLDTGVGKGAYAFVSQQEIDSVLSARPEDRRELFEEAAGIKKYRVKKREALRKLEAAEANLSRVRDVLREIETQRQPMEQQAITARRYLLLQERLHEIEIGLLVGELKKADYELKTGRAERDADQASLLKFDAELTRLERASVETGERLARAEGDLESARLAQQTWMSRVERLESQSALLRERSKMAGQTRAQVSEELAAIERQIANLKTSLEVDQTDRAEVEQEERVQRTEWASRKAALEELERAVRDALHQAEARQSERVRLAQQRATREAALKAAEERAAELANRLARADLENRAQETLGVEARERASAASALRDERTAAAAALAERRLAHDEALRRAASQQAAVRAALDSARRSLAEQASRLSTLTELQESHEGFYQGVRAVLNAERRGQIRGHYRAVVDLMTVPEPYRVAIEVAMGGSLQDIVTRTEAEAKAGIEWLKQNRAGRATFLAIPLLRAGSRLDAPHHIDADVENAMDLVQFDPGYEPVMRLLLGRALVAPDMDRAIGLSRRISGWSKIVTTAGELLSPGGALTGGSLQGRGAHLVGRKGEMDDLAAAVPTLRDEVSRRTAELEACQKRQQELEAERTALNREESAIASSIAEAGVAFTAAERDVTRITRELADRANARRSLEAQRQALANDIDRMTREAEAGAAANETAEDAFTTLNEQTRSLASQRDACRARAVALEVEVSRLRERREGLIRSITADRATLASLERQFLQKSAQRAEAETTGADSAAESERLSEELKETRRELAVAEAEVRAATERRQALLAENFATTGSIRDIAQRRSEVTRTLHETELAIARLEMQTSQVSERLQTEYAISRDQALAQPENAALDRNTAIEVGRLRREIRAMGQVNTGAVAEYERLTERFEFLTAQSADLDTSRESLLKTINEIDDSTRGVFMETFDAVRTEFDRLFTRLFEGGSTRLVLTSPEDVLETGIEVIAQPPGKKPQHLSLLSGGERALTATALLFSFLVVRPSPFVLLDEVDAPLDGANVEKFTNLVKEFSDRSQFLLITHNPTTMEAAPTWYGVTMREPGVSSILSYRMPQEAVASGQEPAIAAA